MPGPTRTAIWHHGQHRRRSIPRTLEVLPGVLELIRVTKPYKLASREMHRHDTVISLPQGNDRRVPASRSWPARARSRTKQ